MHWQRRFCIGKHFPMVWKNLIIRVNQTFGHVLGFKRPYYNDEKTPSNPSKYETPFTVEANGLYKFFNQHPVLNDVSLTINTGETTVLLGSSGCGKSTLLRCINGLEKPDSGELFVNQTPLHQLGKHFNWLTFRKEVGFVFQQYNLFPHLNVLQNITLAPQKVKKLSAEEAKILAISLLKQFGLADKAHTPVQELSGGQKQRIAIARALAMQPKLLLLDEPTSALDPVMSQEVLDAIEILAKQNVTLVIVTHEVGFAFAVADKIVFMDQGKVIYQGPPQSFTAEVINNHPALQSYFSQFQQKQQLLINLSPLQSR